MYATEIQKHLIENQVVDLQRLISHVLTRDLGYSCKNVDNSSKRELIIII